MEIVSKLLAAFVPSWNLFQFCSFGLWSSCPNFFIVNYESSDLLNLNLECAIFLFDKWFHLNTLAASAFNNEEAAILIQWQTFSSPCLPKALVRT